MPAPSETPQMVEVSFALQVGDGHLEASAQVPNGPVTLTALLPVLQELCSNVVAATTDVVRQEGYAISCRAGCGACCRQFVPVNLFEAESLAAWLLSLPEDQQAILESRFAAAVAALGRAGIVERLQPENAETPGSREEHQLALDYLSAGVPCPFLINESCGIYPIRPLVCREYLVTSPPQFCASPTWETVKPVPMPLKLSRAMVKLGSTLNEGDRGWIPLVFLFEWIKAGTKSASYEARGPEMLRRVIEQLAPQRDTGLPEPA